MADTAKSAPEPVKAAASEPEGTNTENTGGSGAAAARALQARGPALKCVLFLGSARSAPPFWGGLPNRTGDRVLKYVEKGVAAHNASNDDKLALEIVDPLQFPSCTNLLINNGNPTYYATRDTTTLPEDLQKLIKLVEGADCFLIVTPEYNHSLPPALTAMMNQVGCSKYANKVSGCVCYSGFSSAGGGTRAAVALRPYLSELGCLPVSKQVSIPHASKVIDEEGEWVGEHKDGAAKTLGTMLEQVSYFASALSAKKAARAAADQKKEASA